MKLALYGACLMVAVCGCGRSGEQLFPVTGKVMVNGKPAAGALVFLHREGRADPNEPVPYGTAKDDGSFDVITREPGDGVKPGDYKVTIYFPDMSQPEDGNGQRPDVLNGKYELPQNSQISASIKAQENVIPPLDLTPGPPRGRTAPNPNAK